MKKIILAACLYSILSSAFAIEVPEACPDLSLLKTTGFIGGIDNPNGLSFLNHRNYIGVYQIDSFGTKELWDVAIAKPYSVVGPFGNITNTFGEDSLQSAAKLARDILSKTSGNPTPIYFTDGHWECQYTTDAPEKVVVAFTPLPYAKEE